MSDHATAAEIREILDHHEERNRQRIERVYDKIDEHTSTLAAIDERTRQHEGRMDRADRRAGTLGSIAGAVVLVIGEGARRLFGSD